MRGKRIAFIGGGNMARAIIGGLLDSGCAIDDIAVAEPYAATRDSLLQQYPGLLIAADNRDIATAAETLILAVKPQVLKSVCIELADVVQAAKPLVISIAAGTRSGDINSWLGGTLPVVRVMPNQPSLIGMGISGMYANATTSDTQKANASDIMSAVGKVVWVDSDAQIDAVTAVSGSGPAYMFLFIDLLTKSAIEVGLEPAVALELAVETARGAATLAAEQSSTETMESLIARVRSPGGTTAAALDAFDASGLHAIFASAVAAARDRAVELADEAGNNQ